MEWWWILLLNWVLDIVIFFGYVYRGLAILSFVKLLPRNDSTASLPHQCQNDSNTLINLRSHQMMKESLFQLHDIWFELKFFANSCAVCFRIFSSIAVLRNLILTEFVRPEYIPLDLIFKINILFHMLSDIHFCRILLSHLPHYVKIVWVSRKTCMVIFHFKYIAICEGSTSYIDRHSTIWSSAFLNIRFCVTFLFVPSRATIGSKRAFRGLMGE